MNIPGWQPLIICGDTVQNLCQFKHLIILANNLIQDLVIVATMVTTFVLMYAGIKLLIATFEGNVGALGQVKKMLQSVIIGYVVIVAGWVIVYTILHALVDPSYWLLG